MDRAYTFKRIEFIKDLTFLEKIFSWLMKFFLYVIGYIPILDQILKLKKNLSPNIFKNQSYAYEENGEIVYRKLGFENGLAEDPDNFQNVAEYLIRSAKMYPKRQLAGNRKVNPEIKTIDPITKNISIKLNLGEYEWKSYEVFYQEVLKLALFLKNHEYSKNGKKIIMFAETSEDWLKMSFALFYIGCPYITIYASLPDESILNIMATTDASSIFVDAKTYIRIQNNINQYSNVDFLILSSKCKKDTKELFNSKEKRVCVMQIGEIIATAETPNENSFICETKLDDIALIMYTSGSTGEPKGVIITHQNIICANRVLADWDIYDIKKNCSYVGYLPMAHIFELTIEHLIVRLGGRIGYGSPLTLTCNSPILADGCLGDLNLIKPDIITSVPLVLERIRKSVFEKIKTRSRLFQIIFQDAYNIKASFLEMGYQTSFIDKLIFHDIKSIIGGNVKVGAVGGAITPIETEEFSRICLGNIQQGYGMTETVCCGAFNYPTYIRPGSNGPPTNSNEIKLRAWEEGSYFPNASPPRGEIMISGKCVANGYYNDEKLSKEFFIVDEKTSKRWFLTGDIGEYQPDGTFKIIDRKKDIIKLSHGEYVALSKIEIQIQSLFLVEICCVIPNSKMNSVIALIIPKRDEISKITTKLDISKNDTSFESLIKNEVVIMHLSSLLKEHIFNKLTKFEYPSKYIFLSDIWTPESGLITASMKVRRHKIALKYQSLIN